MTPHASEPDRFVASVVAEEPGLWTFRVDGWSDPWATWRHAVSVKLAAGQDAAELANDLEIGARLLQRVGRRPGERPNRDAAAGRGERAARRAPAAARSGSARHSSPPCTRS